MEGGHGGRTPGRGRGVEGAPQVSLSLSEQAAWERREVEREVYTVQALATGGERPASGPSVWRVARRQARSASVAPSVARSNGMAGRRVQETHGPERLRRGVHTVESSYTWKATPS
jgi:hypothetical protein